MTYSRDELHAAAWRKGALKWLLYPYQHQLYDVLRDTLNSDDPTMTSYVLDCARRFGKSTICFILWVEQCLRYPGTTWLWVSPLKSQTYEFIMGETFHKVFSSEICPAPPDCVPEFKPNQQGLVFPNGSRIRMNGSDNRNYEALRGGDASGLMLDEAGFMSNLTDGVLPALQPMLLNRQGKTIFASTPPEQLDHDYYEVLRDHDESGRISTFTIWDNKALTEAHLQSAINTCRGRDTTMFKREFECARIAESDKQVLPELSKELMERLLVEPVKHELHHNCFIKYVVADWGGRDKTAILFAHYNNHDQKVYVEDHLDLSGTKVSPATIAAAIKSKTAELWPYNVGSIRYICDSNNVIVQQDMALTYKIPFVPTSKGPLGEMVGKVRDWIYADRIRFWKPAEFALKSAATAHWDKNRSGFAKSKTFGHYDHLAALIYLIRNLDVTTNPIPLVLNFDPETQFMSPQTQQELWKQRSALNQIFRTPNA